MTDIDNYINYVDEYFIAYGYPREELSSANNTLTTSQKGQVEYMKFEKQLEQKRAFNTIAKEKYPIEEAADMANKMNDFYEDNPGMTFKQSIEAFDRRGKDGAN